MPPSLPADERACGLFLVGPTAVGKTAVAHALAARLGRPVLSADAMLVYRGMDIGTAKPSRAEISRYRYAGVDLADPDRDFSVADFLRAVPPDPATRWIVCGGTGLYLRCLAEGLRPAPAACAAVRARCEELLATGGIALLQAELGRIAPDRLAALADPKNPRRLIRAIEAAGPGGAPPAAPDREGRSVSGPPAVLVGLRMEKMALERRIRARVARMYADGLLEEAAGLRRTFVRLSRTALQAIGYAEAFAVLDGRMTRPEAMERTAIRTRQLAKRQMTWFRHQHAVAWIDVTEDSSLEQTAAAVVQCWEQHGPIPLHIGS